MSFLTGRIAAGKEGAYFLQESKQAVTRLAKKSKPSTAANPHAPPRPGEQQQPQADVLPEVLRHSLPSKIYAESSDPSSLSRSSKWILRNDTHNNGSSVSPDALNPLRGYVALPRVTFGPKRWQLPEGGNGVGVSASTANELRRDKTAEINPEKLKAAAEGLAYVGKAFAVATAIVFGGATLLFSTAASKLDMHSIDDIRAKGRDLVQPTSGVVKEQLIPLRTWAEHMSRKWHLERDVDIKEKPIVKELSKVLGPKTSS